MPSARESYPMGEALLPERRVSLALARTFPKFFHQLNKSYLYINIIKKLRTFAEFFRPLSTLDLSRAKATGANVNGTVSTVNNCLYLTDVGLPGSVGLTVRVGNVMSKGNALTANATLSHFDTS
jgi:hypothetical protein